MIYVLEQKYRNVYPCKPQCFTIIIKVGCKGVLRTWACYPDAQIPELARMLKSKTKKALRYRYGETHPWCCGKEPKAFYVM